MGAVAALSLVNAQSALAANESAKDMTCEEFIDLNQSNDPGCMVDAA